MQQRDAPPGWFGHPKGLTILFLTEMWERFSYYGMRALLVYYMMKALGFPQQQASTVYGIFTACVYLTPIVGGFLADRVFGLRRNVIAGALIMALGHFVLAWSELLYLGLAMIAIGNGLFLPSLPSQVTRLYEPTDPRRDRAFTVYYVGVNVGGLLAPVLCGTLGELYGWHYGFGAAGVGMLCGLGFYLAGTRHLPPEPTRPQAMLSRQSAFRELDRRRLIIMVSVLAIVILFRAAYEQTGNTIALWADQGIDRVLQVGSWRFEIPMTWFQALNPLLVIILTPILANLWMRQSSRGKEPTTLRKMAIGSALVGIAYLQATLATASAHGVVGLGAPLLYFLLLTLGELFILPIGLGLFARLAPPTLTAFVVACWFSAIALGNLLAGALGTLWSRLPVHHFFLICAGIAFSAALLLRWLDPFVEQVPSGPKVSPQKRIAEEV